MRNLTRRKTKKRLAGPFILATAALLLLNPDERKADAEPTWWPDAKQVPELATQTGRGVVLYFESPKAADCVKMDRVTWPAISQKEADANFIWLRLNPQDHSTFFTHYEIFQTPQIVVLNHELKEVLRIPGFVDAPMLMPQLEQVPKGEVSVVTSPSGQVVQAANEHQALTHRQSIAAEGHFFFESFDDYKHMSDIQSPLFQPIAPSASRIEWRGGVYGSSCLIIDSGSMPNASIRIDISPGLDQIDQILGRMRVKVRLRAIEVGQDAANVGALVIVNSNEPATSPRAKRHFFTLANRHSEWYEREVVTDIFNFKTQKAYITFQVNWPAQSFGVDDLTVDLLPPTDNAPIAAAATPIAPPAAAPDPTALLAPPTEPPLYRKHDKNKDGLITRDEMKDNPRLFDLWDLNKDGVINLKEAVEGTKKVFK